MGHRSLLSASGDSDANTVCGVRDHSAPRFAPPPPATSAAKPIALLADCPQFLPSARTLLARNQAQVTGYLLAPCKPAHIADGQHERQRRVGTDSRLGHQQLRLRMLIGSLLHRLIQLTDLLL